MAIDAVVVGAGLAGLTAGRHLQRAGLEVTVLEAAPVVGGRVATDVVDGFLLDRGFQVLNTSYPALRDELDLRALDLREFIPGVAIRGADAALHRLLDPRRARAQAWRTAMDTLMSPAAKLAVLRMTIRAATGDVRPLLADADRSTADYLCAAGLDGPATEQFLRPLLAGIFGERDLATSARYFTLVWRSLARGSSTLPSRGMAAVANQLAARLTAGTVCCGQTVLGVAPGRVRTTDGEITARAVVVATDPPAATALLPGLDVPLMRGLTTYYHVAEQPPSRLPLIHLDGTASPSGTARMHGTGSALVNTSVLTCVAPSYSPDHRHLISSTVLGTPGTGAPGEPDVRRLAGTVYGADSAHWDHLGTAIVPQALCSFTPPTPDRLRRDATLGDGLFVAGDHRATPSIQGALVSGRRAAQAVLIELGLPAAAA
ncbi:MAG: NAD(P)/FAD-dependent oxidoreductase [Pseudonocardiales bacterium]